MEDFPGFPENLQDQVPSFPETDALFRQMGNYSAADISATVRGLSVQGAINLFFATFYRPVVIPADLEMDAESFDADEIIATMGLQDSDTVFDPVRVAISSRTDIRSIDLLKWAVSAYPKALEWLRTNGFMTNPKTRRINTKLLLELSPFVREPALDAFSSILGYAIKDNTDLASRTDIVVAGYAMGMPGAMAPLLEQRGVQKAAAHQIFTSGPATAVVDLVQAAYPDMMNYAESWNPSGIIEFMNMVNGLLDKRQFNPESRQRVTLIVRDVYIHSLIVKDKAVERATKKWVSDNDPVVAFVRGGGSEAAKSSGVMIDSEYDDTRDIPRNDPHDNPIPFLTAALVTGNLKKQPGQASVEEALEIMGLVWGPAAKTSFKDIRMRAVASHIIRLFESDEKALHPRVLSFAIDFVTGYAEYTRSAKFLGPVKTATVLIGGKEWSRENALDVYFDKSVFVIMAPDFENTPINYFRLLALAGDDDAPGAAHLFDVLVRHFGIVLALGFKRVPSVRVAKALFDACSLSLRKEDTAAGVVIITLENVLMHAYPSLRKEYTRKKDGFVVDWAEDPVKVAARRYQQQWKPDTDWLTTSEVQMLVR